jgi:lipopolysaccharide/colanic/teichoic acid biosynthesis glycosyltransferase
VRRYSLDELPQLWNVLKGEMSLVAPRPPLLWEVEAYEDWQLDRLEVRPGITRLWQVSGRSELPFNEYVCLDLF